MEKALPTEITSDSHPLLIRHIPAMNITDPYSSAISIHVCSCPGKFVSGRMRRNLAVDMQRIHEVANIASIGCLLSDAELRSLGIDPSQYRSMCAQSGIRLVSWGLVDGSAPANVEEMDRFLISLLNATSVSRAQSSDDPLHPRGESHQRLEQQLRRYRPLRASTSPIIVYEPMNELPSQTDNLSRQERRILVHCRGGLGRAGTVAACLLLRIHSDASAQDAIRHVRLHRPGAIETQRQVDFISLFAEWRHTQPLWTL
eukprot:TRINITY_DN16256_c0_g1_i1.p1 TRINITY_DN16256_c0_g1~~TRINITY_DN16256_c0_g1_i1.p1  ORF type:complete len:258 (+),score=43.93 TRINITY_DN16256_c0_g1_i1:61-834(+)